MKEDKLDLGQRIFYGAGVAVATSVILLFGAALWVMFIRWVQGGC